MKCHVSFIARFFVVFILCITFLAACESFSAQSFDDKGRGQRYDLHGKIVSIDKLKGQVTVTHEAIPNYMDGMTMPFKVKEREALSDMHAGDELKATLVVSDERTWLENPIITQGDGGTNTANDSVAAAHSVEAQPNAVVPDFAFRNQDDKPIHTSEYRGRTLLVTFIYTRCPLPDYCPLMTSNFAAIERELQLDKKLYARTHLLTITIDPDYDTPQVLRDYATTRAGLKTFEHWEFATESPAQIQKIAQFFGLNYFKENGQIIHALRTAVVAPNGRIYKIYGDNLWKPEDLLRDVRTLLNEDSNQK
ncbi:MAG: SCO family protein [Pyrinomonadaceae bacterium]